MRYDQVHSALDREYIGIFQPERMGHSHRVTRLVTQRLTPRSHIFTLTTVEEMYATHLGASQGQEEQSEFFTTVEDDYSNVESYLRQAFRAKSSLYVSDIANALGLEYGVVREIIARMMREGKLAPK